MNTLEELKEKAASMELRGANFLDSKGNIAVVKELYTRVQFVFIDGTEITVSRDDTQTPEFNDMKFMLRTEEDHA